MTLLLIRHATADTPGLPGGDFARSLVEKGKEQSLRVGRFLKTHDLIPEVVLTSPVFRAKETASLLQKEGCPEPITEPWLACGMRPEVALHELAAFKKFKTVAIVGHEPDFSSLVEHILGADTYSIRVKKASIISIELDHQPSLNFSIPCRLIK